MNDKGVCRTAPGFAWVCFICQEPINICKDPKIKRNSKCKNYLRKNVSRDMPKSAIRSLTRSLQTTRKGVFRNGTHRQTDDSQTLQLRDLIGSDDQCSENVD